MSTVLRPVVGAEEQKAGGAEGKEAARKVIPPPWDSRTLEGSRAIETVIGIRLAKLQALSARGRRNYLESKGWTFIRSGCVDNHPVSIWRAPARLETKGCATYLKLTQALRWQLRLDLEAEGLILLWYKGGR